jgi:hypothetical protein
MPAIKGVMTPFPYSVDAGASVADAQAFMREQVRRTGGVSGGGDDAA